MAAAAKPPDFSTHVDEEDIEVSDTHLNVFSSPDQILKGDNWGHFGPCQ